MSGITTAKEALVKDGRVVWPDRCPSCHKALIEAGNKRICVPCGQTWFRPVAKTKK